MNVSPATSHLASPPNRRNPVPTGLQSLISSWMPADYTPLNQGYLITQTYRFKNTAMGRWMIQLSGTADFWLHTDEPMLVLQFTLQGGFRILAEDRASIPLGKNRYGLLYIPAGKHRMEGTPGYSESLHIELDGGLPEELSEGDPDFREFANRWQNKDQRPAIFYAASLNYSVAAILENIKSCTRTGGSLRLELQKCILELFSAYGDAYRDHVLKLAGQDYHADLHRQVREFILTEPHIKRQTLAKLARQFLVSVSVLKKHFSRSEGMSLGRFVHFHALNRARQLMLSTHKSYDEIADEIGYEHTGNFQRAFKKQFGLSPDKLRNPSKDNSPSQSDENPI